MSFENIESIDNDGLISEKEYKILKKLGEDINTFSNKEFTEQEKQNFKLLKQNLLAIHKYTPLNYESQDLISKIISFIDTKVLNKEDKKKVDDSKIINSNVQETNSNKQETNLPDSERELVNSSIYTLIENWEVEKWVIMTLLQNTPSMKEFILNISSKESLDRFLIKNFDLLVTKEITTSFISEEDIKLNDMELTDEEVKIVLDSIYKEILRNNRVSWKISKDLIDKIWESIEKADSYKKKFLLILLRDYWVDEKKHEADKYFDNLWYKWWDASKNAWCAVSLNSWLKEAWVQTLLDYYKEHPDKLKKLKHKYWKLAKIEEFLNVRAANFAEKWGPGHVWVKLWDNILYWWNQSNKFIFKTPTKPPAWYREITEDWKLWDFVKEHDFKKIPFWAIVVYTKRSRNET